MTVSGFRFVNGDGQTIEKDTLSELDFGVDHRKWLLPGEIITNSTWEVPSTIIKMPDPAEGINGGITFLWLKGGGPVGNKHVIRNFITTDQKRKRPRSFTIIMAKQ